MCRLSLLSDRRSMPPSRPRLEPAGDDRYHIGLGSLSPHAAWIELCPSPLGFPAAAARVTAAKRWTLPLRGLEFLDAPLYLQVLDEAGRELEGYSLEARRDQSRLTHI